jgi:hypothetical protein
LFHDPKSLLVDFCEGELASCEILSSTVSIEVLNEINVFPNPSKGVFHISIKDGYLKGVKIYAINGELKEEIYGTIIIDLSAMDKGVYFMELIFRNGERFVETVIKEN